MTLPRSTARIKILQRRIQQLESKNMAQGHGADTIAEARHWLRNLEMAGAKWHEDIMRALIALAEQPRIPEEPTIEMRRLMKQASGESMTAIYRALYAHIKQEQEKSRSPEGLASDVESPARPQEQAGERDARDDYDAYLETMETAALPEVAHIASALRAARRQKALDDRLLGIFTEALEMIAGKRQCIDNLMSNADIARKALEEI